MPPLTLTSDKQLMTFLLHMYSLDVMSIWAKTEAREISSKRQTIDSGCV